MNLNTKISQLIKHGFSTSLIFNLNEGSINALYNRLNEKKEENMEAVTTKVTTEKKIIIPQADAKKQGANIDGVNVAMDASGNIVATTTKEGTNPEEKSMEMDEKFESKKQQKYFYSRCGNKSLSKKERNKWCKMAKEYSSKTDFKKLPEKVSETTKSKLEESIYNFVKNTTFPPITKRDLLKLVTENKK